jgi:hypothetical protein
MAKRKPLVSQHLENISREGLEEYQGGDLVSLNELRKWFLGKKAAGGGRWPLSFLIWRLQS